ncbi:MAG: phytanoyl-CoA dioxygenase family protein [Rhodospirillales bacterium]|nr:phytanoyl-CoA dioxygenase family protein [Rhodospirillales bacterium]
MALSRAQIDGFARDGFVSGIPALSPDEVRLFRDTAEAFERAHPAEARWAFDIKSNLMFDWVYENGRHPRILDAVADLLGPDLLLTNSIFRIKEPGTSTNYGWHQDSARIAVNPCPVIVYVAFSEATPENGCLKVIPGTHHAVVPFELVSNPSQPNRRVARVRDPDVERAVDLTLKPGEIAIFSANAVHGSPPNRSTARRFAVLHDYTPAAARQTIGKGSGQLVRGQDRFGHFAPEPVPGPDFRTNAAMRRRVLKAYPENILMGPLEPGQAPEFPDAA